ncbi:terminase TerL endonuclease subunit [Aurantimonas sp. 22II-16-19i]|uniref:terminase large subunit n=1 Tax=Aurantimonas sp. 22II-16-19i TaxID=1317114 RepID=UPI0009F8DB6E|nr:terminase TerL endonuclease subunit [Aurantimonas sp. 22II-16-19i]
MRTKTYPSWIDDGSEIPDPFGYGERAVNFLRNLRHPKSTLPGHAFALDPWMERIIRRIYGPRHADGTRIVKTVFAMIPRGNRKTTLGAALTLLHAIGPEKVPGGQIVCAAADQKQARIAFEEATSVIRADKRLVSLVDIADYRNRLRDNRSGSIVEAISADAKTQHGRTPTFTLMDELHAWPKRDLWEALKTGLLKTPGSLNVIITTAGRGQTSIAFETYDYARKVALGEIDDPATLPIIFEAPKDCDWRDEAVWHAVNPGLSCGYPDLDGLRQFAREAANRPGDRESFRQLNLNVWLDHHNDPFVEMDVYDAGRDPIDFERLKAVPCFIAVDMSISTDLSAVVAAWRDPDDEEAFIVRPFFFCPANNLRAKAEKDGVPYPTWAEAGFITPTPGDVIDYRAIVECIRELVATFTVAEIVYDRAYAMPVVLGLQEYGIDATAMALDPKSQNDGVMRLERAIGARKFSHGGHPVLRWNMANVSIYTGPSGLRTMHKGRSTDRIDGAFAAWMAVARAASNDFTPSVYADPDCDPASWFAAA